MFSCLNHTIAAMLYKARFVFIYLAITCIRGFDDSSSIENSCLEFGLEFYLYVINTASICCRVSYEWASCINVCGHSTKQSKQSCVGNTMGSGGGKTIQKLGIEKERQGHECQFPVHMSTVRNKHFHPTRNKTACTEHLLRHI